MRVQEKTTCQLMRRYLNILPLVFTVIVMTLLNNTVSIFVIYQFNIDLSGKLIFDASPQAERIILEFY